MVRVLAGPARRAGFGVAVAVVAAACQHAAPPAPPPPDVTVDTVEAQRVAQQFEFTGQVEARRQVEVHSPVNGVIVSQTLPEGSQVAAGTVLFQIDTVTYAAAYRGALAQQADARAHLDNARRTLARLQPLLGSHAVAQLDVDNAETAVEQAQATLENTTAAVDAARKNLSDATIRAEISGRVGKANMVNGARVTGSDQVLTTIDQVDTVRVTFRPSIDQVLDWRHDPLAERLLRPGGGAVVRAVLPDGTIDPRPGRIDFVAPVVDSVTGTQSFRAEFLNPDHLLTPGEFVRVRVEGLTRDSALLVPQRAVQQSLGHTSVYLLGPRDTVEIRDVVVTSWVGDRWLVDSGLASGDRVIVDGVQKVRPGMVAHPVPATGQ